VISDPWINRQPKRSKQRGPYSPRPRAPATDLLSHARRELLKELGKCIDGPLDGFVSARLGIVHGAPFQGGRCKRCWMRVKARRK